MSKERRKAEIQSGVSTFSVEFAAFASRIKEQFCLLSVAVASAIVFFGNSFFLSDSTAQRFGEANQFVCDLFDSPGDFFVGDAITVEGVGRGKGEPRNNDATKIKHEAIGIRHDRHITCCASSRT